MKRNFRQGNATSPNWLQDNISNGVLQPDNKPLYDIDGLVQDCSIPIALAMEVLQSCTKSSIWCFMALMAPMLKVLWSYIDGLVQDGSNSNALAMDLPQSRTKLMISYVLKRPWGQWVISVARYFRGVILFTVLPNLMEGCLELKCHNVQICGIRSRNFVYFRDSELK